MSVTIAIIVTIVIIVVGIGVEEVPWLIKASPKAVCEILVGVASRYGSHPIVIGFIEIPVFGALSQL